MAGVDYVGIRAAVATLLQDGLTDIRVFVEEEPQFGMSDHGRAMGVYILDRRQAPVGGEPLRAGRQTRWHIRISIWTFFFNMESFAKAVEGRDTLLSDLELLLMQNRTLGGKVSTSWMDGGELFSAKDPQTNCYVAGAETVVVAETSAINS